MWHEVVVCLKKDVCEQIYEMMFFCGANGVSIEGSGLQASLVKDNILLPLEELPIIDSYDNLFYLSAYFPTSKRADLFAKELLQAMEKAHFGDEVLKEIIINPHDETKWEDEWKKYYHAVKPGSVVVVVPAWESYVPQVNEKIVLIDPGMAFGSGTHESTSMCIKLLEKSIKGNENVADIGCGSGILGLSALALGAINVDGVEIDKVALKVAKKNAALNTATSRFNPIQADGAIALPDDKYDVVIANIVASVIESNLISIKRIMKKTGVGIFSGIIGDKWPGFCESLLLNGFIIQDKCEEKNWIAVRVRLGDNA
jgi:ribosomal protein L11 methyltransferase